MTCFEHPRCLKFEQKKTDALCKVRAKAVASSQQNQTKSIKGMIENIAPPLQAPKQGPSMSEENLTRIIQRGIQLAALFNGECHSLSKEQLPLLKGQLGVKFTC